MAPDAQIHPTATLGQNVQLAAGVTIGADVRIGNNVTLYEGVTVGAGTRIFDGAVIGRPPQAAGKLTRPIAAADQPVTIGSGCVLGANCVLYNNLTIGNDVLVGDLASIREGCVLQDSVVVGRGVMMMYDTTVETRSRIIDGAVITGNMLIESDVFIGPNVTTINDNDVYLKRFGLKEFSVKGPVIRRFAVIGSGACLAADVTINMGAIVAPSSMVTKDVPAWSIVVGVPATVRRQVDDEARLAVLRHFDLDGSSD